MRVPGAHGAPVHLHLRRLGAAGAGHPAEATRYWAGRLHSAAILLIFAIRLHLSTTTDTGADAACQRNNVGVVICTLRLGTHTDRGRSGYADAEDECNRGPHGPRCLMYRHPTKQKGKDPQAKCVR
eukprot:1927933-Pyramimonas_sp.AAC.1